MPVPRVLIDAFNSALPQATGIATYARALTHAYHRLGDEVVLLTDAQLPAGGGSPGDVQGKVSSALSTIDPILLFDHFGDRPRRPAVPERAPLPWYIRNRFFSIRGLAHRFDALPGADTGAPPVRLVRELDRVDQGSIRPRLGHFDGIINGPDLFSRALGQFHRTRRPIEIDLPVAVDIAHFTWCLPIRARNARKNIYTLHDLIPLRFPYFTLDEKGSYFDLVRWCCSAADMIVTVSEHSRRDIIELMGMAPEKVINTYQALEPDFAQRPAASSDPRPSLRHMFGFGEGEYFLMMGSIEPRKNVGRAIEAHLAAATGFPLVICGPKGPQAESELRLLDNPHVQRHWAASGSGVIVLNYVPRRLLQLLIAGTRAVLVPSVTEGFGLPALEAMTLGAPVIAAKAGGLPEVCGPAALYVDPYKVDDLREAIAKMARLAPGELAEFKSRSRAQANVFSFESYCTRLSELQASLLG